MIAIATPMWRTARHIEETAHSVKSFLYTMENRRLTLAQCDGCDFKDWMTEVEP